MMVLKKFAAFLVVFAIAGAIAFWFANKAVHQRAMPLHVFINETSDHRFDESIKVSILAAEKRTGVQNAVVISNRDNEDGVERVAESLFAELQLGRKSRGRAILYYFNPKSRALKIEVGHALEGVLPDATVKGLETAAKSFIFIDRYQDFWAELINTLNIEIQNNEKSDPIQNYPYDFNKFKFLSGGGGIVSRSYSDSWRQLLLESRRAPTTLARTYSAQADVRSAVNLYLQTLEQGYGDFDFDLLSPESQFFRKMTPQTSYQMFRNAKMYERAGIDRIIEADAFAFVFFRPGNPVLPLVLQQKGGRWRIHEALSWSLFQRFEDSSHVFLKFPIVTSSKELTAYLKSKLTGPLYNLQSPLVLADLAESPKEDWKSTLLQLYWLEKAEVQLEAKSKSELTIDELMLAADVHLNLGHFTKFLEVYEALAKRLPADETIQKNLQFYRETFAFKDDDWTLRLH